MEGCHLHSGYGRKEIIMKSLIAVSAILILIACGCTGAYVNKHSGKAIRSLDYPECSRTDIVYHPFPVGFDHVTGRPHNRGFYVNYDEDRCPDCDNYYTSDSAYRRQACKEQLAARDGWVWDPNYRW